MRAASDNHLDNCKGLQALDPELRARLGRAGTVRTFPKGASLWKRGDAAKWAFVVLSGRIGVFDTIGDGRLTVIDFFGPGSVIAGGPTLTRVSYLFSGKAVDESQVFLIPVDVYRRHVRRDHSLALMTALNLVHTWRRLVIQLRDLKQLSANQRLGFYLLAQTDQRSGGTVIRLPDDQLMIAGILGVTRQSLSRSFAQLRRYGVAKRGRDVTLSDIRGLRKFCNARPLM